MESIHAFATYYVACVANFHVHVVQIVFHTHVFVPMTTITINYALLDIITMEKNVIVAGSVWGLARAIMDKNRRLIYVSMESVISIMGYALVAQYARGPAYVLIIDAIKIHVSALKKKKLIVPRFRHLRLLTAKI